jgi:Cu(I)/Ag(I) efflux system membrane fusion protein
MSTSKFLTAAMAAWVFAGCADRPSKENRTEREGTAPAEASSEPAQPSLAFHPEFRAAVGRVLNGYFRIQTALAEDDLPMAMEAFSSMHAVLHMMPMDGLDASAKAYWDSTDVAIMDALHPMAAAASLDSVRVHFTVFSSIMAEVVEAVGLEEGKSIFRFHCPMANLRQGADWMQDHGTLKNPYFGRSMPACGNPVGTREG